MISYTQVQKSVADILDNYTSNSIAIVHTLAIESYNSTFIVSHFSI